MKPLNLIYAFDYFVYGEESLYKSILFPGLEGYRRLVLRYITEMNLWPWKVELGLGQKIRFRLKH